MEIKAPLLLTVVLAPHPLGTRCRGVRGHVPSAVPWGRGSSCDFGPLGLYGAGGAILACWAHLQQRDPVVLSMAFPCLFPNFIETLFGGCSGCTAPPGLYQLYWHVTWVL